MGTVAPPGTVGRAVEFKVDLDFVVLEGNKRKGKTWVAAEPEFKRNVEGGLFFAVFGMGEGRNVTNHAGVAVLVASGLGEFVPDVEPVTVVLVNALTADFDFNVLDELVADPVGPAHSFTGSSSYSWKSNFKVYTVHEVTVAGNSAGDLLAEVGRTVEGLFDSFHREIGVPTVNDFEECNLRVTSKVNVLCAICYELH